MTVYGDVAIKAWGLATNRRLQPPEAWRKSIEECKAPDKSCPKGAFLGLCENGVLRDIDAGKYTRSKKSSAFALTAVELLCKDPTLVNDKARLEATVYGDRTPNGEVDVCLALWRGGIVLVGKLTLARESAKLDPTFEKRLAEEGMS